MCQNHDIKLIATVNSVNFDEEEKTKNGTMKPSLLFKRQREKWKF